MHNIGFAQGPQMVSFVEVSKGQKNKVQHSAILRPSDQCLLSSWMLHGTWNVSPNRLFIQVILCLLKYDFSDVPSLLCFPSLPSICFHLNPKGWSELTDSRRRFTDGVTGLTLALIPGPRVPAASSPPSPSLIFRKQSDQSDAGIGGKLGLISACCRATSSPKKMTGFN